VKPRISDETLKKFIDQTYHWKSLTFHHQMIMAVELQERRANDEKMIKVWRESVKNG
jgi:hypothetical protein